MRPARRKAIRSHEQLGQAEDLIRYTPFMKRFLHSWFYSSLRMRLFWLALERRPELLSGQRSSGARRGIRNS
jgi:hypothetical protein